EFAARRAELEKQQAEQLTAAQARGEKLAGLNVQIAQKAGVDGRLFGSVTNYDIAEAVTKQGFEVAKSEIRMPEGPLKTVGDHPVSIALHHDVVVDITVTVVAEA
ncbi:MAG TPA: 50S ribosomal protein L9, partial [Methylophilaceae bacterium]|nr:50S ribosomal protein L9 [Methylophilaceae bacterium]